MIRIDVSPIDTQAPWRIDARIDDGREPLRIWWASNGQPLAPTADPFVIAAVPVACELGVPIATDSPVSEATRQWANAWAAGRGMAVPVIIAPCAAPGDASETQRGTGAFTSGGSLSQVFVAKHHASLTHLVHVHGFSLPLHDIDGRRAVSENLTEISTRWKLPLVEMATNLRSWSDTRSRWYGGYRIAALAAAAAVLAPTLDRCVAPGVEPIADHMLPVPPIVDEIGQCPGANHPLALAIDRIEALRRVAADREMLRALWVCDDPRCHGSNCGKCLRCIETMVLLQAEGVLDRCPAFQCRLDLARLRRIQPELARTKETFAAALARLRERRTDPDLVDVLAAILEPARRRTRPFSWWTPRGTKEPVEV